MKSEMQIPRFYLEGHIFFLCTLILYIVFKKKSSEGCGIPADEIDQVKTGEEFLDLLQSYGIISRFHVTYLPWLLRKADGGRDLVKDWKQIDQAESLFVSHMPALPKGVYTLCSIVVFITLTFILKQRKCQV